MRFAKFIVPYVIISPASVAVFFIALFVSCISVEFAMHAVLNAVGVLPLVSQTAQNIFVSTAGATTSLFAAALFMNKGVRELREMYVSYKLYHA